MPEVDASTLTLLVGTQIQSSVMVHNGPAAWLGATLYLFALHVDVNTDPHQVMGVARGLGPRRRCQGGRPKAGGQSRQPAVRTTS
jgi:hypothetical protein